MATIYSGAEFNKMLQESIPGYNPVLGPAITSTNKKVNKDSNKETLKNVDATVKDNIKGDSKPVKFNTQVTKDLQDYGDDMLDLEYANDPSKEFKDRIKKGLEGDSTMGNKAGDGSSNEAGKEYYKNSKEKSKIKTDLDHITKTTGIVSKNIDLPKRPTAFESIDERKIKRLNFKNTSFLSENHIMTLIPEDYKKDGNKFIMKDKFSDEYLIEWKITENENKGVVVAHENKVKLNEEFNRIKNLYNFKPEKDTKLTRLQEDNAIKNVMDKVRTLLEE